MENYEKKYKNTLEVKDVNLEKEIELIKGDYEQVDVAWNNDFDFIARHFFELGLKAYEKKYKNALEWARRVMNGETGFIRKEVEEVFPELAESEDEKIRKELKRAIAVALDYSYFDKETADNILAWLEKQESVEEIVERCKKSWYNEGKIAGMAEGLTDDEKYQQGWHDALEKQGEQNPAWSGEDENNLNGVITELEANKSEAPEYDYKTYDRFINWLESLKERIDNKKKGGDE